MKPLESIEELIQLLEKKPLCSLGCIIALDVDGNRIVLDGNEGKVHQNATNADCSVSTTLADISDILEGKLDPTAAFMMGKITVEGDLAVAMKLQTFLT